MAINQAKVFTVTSVKGGVGKTVTVLNLAGIFSKMRKRTLIIDLDLYGSAIAASLNVPNEQDIYKLIYDLNNNKFKQLEDYIAKYNDFIDVIPAPKDPRLSNKINSKYLNIILNRVKLKYDVVLIDTNHILDEINLVTFDLSDQIVYIMSNDPMDLKNMKTMISICKDMQKTNYFVILNDSKDRLKHYFNKYDIQNIIKNNIDYVIPADFYLRNFDKYTLDGNILTLDKRVSSHYKKTMKIFESIANSLMKEER